MYERSQTTTDAAMISQCFSLDSHSELMNLELLYEFQKEHKYAKDAYI